MKLDNKNLAIIALCLFLITVFLYSGISFSGSGFTRGTHLIQGLEPSEISEFVISSGSESVHIARSGDQFTVGELAGYPADFEKLNKLIIDLLDITLTSQISTNPGYFSEYQVAEDSQESTRVELKDSQGTTLTGVIIGTTGENLPGPYVRRVDSQTTFAAASPVNISTEAMDYIDAEPFDYDVDKVVRIVSESSESGFTIERTEEEGLDLVNPPSGRSVNRKEVDNLAAALNNLRFNKVESRENAAFTADHTLTVSFTSGLAYQVETAELDDSFFMRARAIAPEEREVFLSRDEGEEQLKEKEEYFLDRERAQAFNDLHGNYVYKLSKPMARSVRKTMEDMLRKEQEE